jgi:prophage antirepressor-like protein
MTNEPALFNFCGSNVRVLDIDGDPWFVAKDVAQVLGYATPQKVIHDHCKASTTVPKRNGGYLTIIPERDVYRLIMRSKLPAAEAFEDWVVGTVLPAIRKDGGYISGEEKLEES